MKISPVIISMVSSICFISAPAPAAQVSNMTDTPQAIVILSGNEPTMVEIPAWGRYFALGALRMKYRQHELYVAENMEYAIWPGNVIGPQRVMRSFIRGN